MKLPKEFYSRPDTLIIAKNLLGKTLCSNIDGMFTSGMIVETEMYCGVEDRGCHAFGGRLTKRTEIMYAEGGVCYVYLCYGIHRLFNVITHTIGYPHAILIRAIQPLNGIDVMLQRINKKKYTDQMAAGPGLLTQCLGIDLQHNGMSLQSDNIWIEGEREMEDATIIESARVGMNFEGFYKTVPWRFRIANSAFTSKAK